ncbi:MAG: DUF6440 family protein [Prevotellaceae bacterium]|jgi:hypothetical protein|nr:DUF6440 family protein [Prevotellaceae bacterium]
MKKEKRFEIIYQEKHGMMKDVFILRDKQTGVQYLFVQNGYGGGLSPLLSEKQKNEL